MRVSSEPMKFCTWALGVGLAAFTTMSCAPEAQTPTGFGGGSSATTNAGTNSSAQGGLGGDFTTSTSTSATGSTSSSGAGGMAPSCAPPQGGSAAWGHGYGDADGQYGSAIAVDSQGNSFVTGAISGTMTLDGITLTSAGKGDVFLAKFDPSGHAIWAHRFGDAKDQSGDAITTDAAGNVIIVGHHVGSIDFGGGTLTAPGCCFENAFAAKFDPNGNHLWSKTFGDIDGQTARGVAADALGNVIVVGNFQTTIDFGNGPLTSAGGYDLFVAKLDSMGNTLWSKRAGDAEDQIARAVAVDAQKNIVLGGDVKGSADFGLGAIQGTAKGAAFIAKLAPTGLPLFTKSFPATLSSVTGIAADASGSIVAVGRFQGSVDFGGGMVTSGIADDVFVAAWDDKGKPLHSERFGDDASQIASAVAVGPSGRVAVSGSFTGTLAFGAAVLTSAGNFDAFVAELDPMGCPLWAKSFGDSAHQASQGVAIDASGAAIATGSFSGVIDPGTGAVTASGDDVFVVKFGP